jgi:hypothetical protein
MTPASATPAPRPRTDSPVLEVFVRGAPQIAADPRFTDHVDSDGTVDWDRVLGAPGWSDEHRVLIQLAALCGDGRVPPGAFGAYLTGRQTSLVLAMCQAARQ